MEAVKSAALKAVHESNEIMTRVGAGTPMGDALRRFWMPALLSDELKRDGAPVRLRVMGEDLVSFRDSDGKVNSAVIHSLAMPDSAIPARQDPIRMEQMAQVE